MLRIYKRSRDSLRSAFMSKESAKCLLAIVEDLMSNVSPGQFAQTFTLCLVGVILGRMENIRRKSG